MSETLLNGRVTLHAGDSRDVLKTIADASIDSIVCDPPYALGGKSNSGCMSRGFMGKQWDNGDTAHAVEFWQECLRVLKPGGHVVAFAGTRTYHRMACAIEDAGFEIRDQLQWLYGSGFPKSHNQGNGWGTALKPAQEPICLARKPLSEKTVAANVLRWKVGAINVDGCRVGTDETITATRNYLAGGIEPGGIDKPGEKTHTVYQQNAAGRWPANVITDGSDEVVGMFPDVHGAGSARNGKFGGKYDATSYDMSGTREMGRFGDEGSAARFFYTAKADSDDRIGSRHPTVKPVDLMQWLVRLVTPRGGLVLDPFAGTGTTGEACFREGMRCTLVEREVEYQADIRRRMGLVLSGPDERARESIKARLGDTPANHGPLFGGLSEAAE